MFSPDSTDISIPSYASRLLSESPPHPSTSQTGHGGDDLSLSELAIADRPDFQRPFSLLARQELPIEGDAILGSGSDDEGGGVKGDEDVEGMSKQAMKDREEKLQSDLFILKKLNASFLVFREALDDTSSANEVSSLLCVWLLSYPVIATGCSN